ncbi:MAG: glutaredoxin 3 [Rhodospirillaceae bacterium]|nr:glutaredoxin 3 [Rhodospirillaceae bacterium]
MAKIEVYTTNVCPYCDRAKQLLRKHNLSFEEINVSSNILKREEMLKRSNGRQTVPQIFINGKHVGGCDDLYALDKAGRLLSMITG